VTIKFYISVETQGAVAVGSSAVLGVSFLIRFAISMSVSANHNPQKKACHQTNDRYKPCDSVFTLAGQSEKCHIGKDAKSKAVEHPNNYESKFVWA
jgi:hypothetical protein